MNDSGLRPRLMPVVLCFLLVCTVGYFFHMDAGWNVNTRMNLTFAIVERGTFRIDAYQDEKKSPFTWTNDKAFFDGHFYCDKPPALSFSAVPAYALLWKARDFSPRLSALYRYAYPQWVAFCRQALTLFTTGLATGLLGCALWGLGRRFGLPDALAFLLAAGLILGTTLGGYGALFYAYLPSSFFSAWAYLALLDGRLKERAGDGDSFAGARLFRAGLLIGIAWFFDITSGLSGLLLSAYALWCVRTRVWHIWKLAAGGMIPVVLLSCYAYSIFHEFSIPYKYEYDDFFRQEMMKGFQGIHAPSLTAFYYLTVHPFKGLFFYSPVLLLAFAGAAGILWQGLRKSEAEKTDGAFPEGMAGAGASATVVTTPPDARFFVPDALLSLAVIAAYFAYNSGYYMWWGGWAAGPRHLCPSIIFYLCPLALWLTRRAWWRLALFGALLAVSVAFNFMILAVDPQIPTGIDTMELMRAKISDNLRSPILNEVVPRFWYGVVDYRGQMRDLLAFNVGNLLLGWQGKTALLPLAMLWAAALGWLAWPLARRKQP